MGVASQYVFIEGNTNGSDIDVDCLNIYGGTYLHITDPDKEFMYYESNYQPVKYDVSTGYEEAFSFTSYVPNYSSGYDEYSESTHRSGYVTVNLIPSVGDTITINGIVFTFKTSTSDITDIAIMPTTYEQARVIQYTVNEYFLTYGNIISAEAYNNVCYFITTASPGTAYAISKVSSSITISGSTMSVNKTKITFTDPWLGDYSSISYDVGYRHIDAALTYNDCHYSFLFMYDTNVLYYGRRIYGSNTHTWMKQLTSVSAKGTYVIPCIGYDGICVAIVRIGYSGEHYVSMYNVDSQLGDPTTTDGIVEYVWNRPVAALGRIVFNHGIPYAIYVDVTTNEEGIAVNDKYVMCQKLLPIGETELTPLLLFENANTITELCVRDNLSYAIRDTYGVKSTYDVGENPILCHNIDGDISNPYDIMYLYPYDDQGGGNA